MTHAAALHSRRLTLALLGTVLGLSLGVPAAQAAVSGSVSGVLFNVRAVPAGALLAGDGSSPALSPINTGITFTSSLTSGSSGAFALPPGPFFPFINGHPAPGGTIIFAVNSPGAPPAPGLASLVFNTGVGTFTSSGLSFFNRNSAVGTVDFGLPGNFVGAGPLVAFSTPLAAQLQFTLTQSGRVAGNAIGAGWSLVVPPPNATDPGIVPGPVALTVFDAGLLGLGLALGARRRAG